MDQIILKPYDMKRNMTFKKTDGIEMKDLCRRGENGTI